MCATQLHCKNTDSILAFFFLLQLPVAPCCCFPAGQCHTRFPRISAGWSSSRNYLVNSLLSALPQRILLPQGLTDNFTTASLLLTRGAKRNDTGLINCANYYVSRGKAKLRHPFLLSLFIDSQAGAATLVFSRAPHRHFPRHSEELTALSTSANIALRILNRRKEPEARWEACEGTHPLARTGRCLVNRRQKEGQSRQRKQPAVSHFLTQIIWLGMRHTSIHSSFPRFQSQGKPILKSKSERQKAARQNCSAPLELLR